MTETAAEAHGPSCTCEDCCAREFEAYRDPEEGGCHHFRDPKTCDECADERAQDQHIEHLVNMLSQGVIDARRGLFAAFRNLDELTGSAYDIELAEGVDGSDARADLEAADKLLRNVERIVCERKRLLKADGR